MLLLYTNFSLLLRVVTDSALITRQMKNNLVLRMDIYRDESEVTLFFSLQQITYFCRKQTQLVSL